MKGNFITNEDTGRCSLLCGSRSGFAKSEKNYHCKDIEVSFETDGGGMICYLTAKDTPVSYLKIYFANELAEDSLVLGDAFERSYGNLEWKNVKDAGFMPWYFFLSKHDRVHAYGVKVRPSALCAWTIEDGKPCLQLDVCNGNCGVVLGGRKLKVAHIVSGEYYGKDVFSACKSFCKKMCDDGIFPEKPIYA